jgi:hypothetical protein
MLLIFIFPKLKRLVCVDGEKEKEIINSSCRASRSLPTLDADVAWEPFTHCAHTRHNTLAP